MSEHFRKLERMYLSAPINAIFKPSIEIADGEATISMMVKENFFHAAHALHGSVYFKCLDDAAFFAANSLVKEEFVLTSQFNVYLIRPVEEGTITAKGRVVQNGKTQIIAESELFADNGKILARGSGIFVRSKMKLEASVGYK